MTQYIVLDRTNADCWAFSITNGQLNIVSVGSGASPSQEPVFLDQSSGGQYVKLFVSNGNIGLESTITIRNDTIILSDTSISANLWQLGSNNYQIFWNEVSPTPLLYDRFKRNLFRGLFDVGGSGSHQLKVVLLNNTYSFSAAHNIYSDISLYEVTGTGYTTGGVLISGFSVTQDDVNARSVFFSSGNPTWTNSTITARYAVIYDATLINRDLVSCIDFLSSYSSVNETFKLTWGSSGILILE